LTFTTRLNLFFLAALAVVLIGFSAALYLLASSYLHRQDEQRLAAALSTLVAAAEVGPEGVVWDLTERRLNLGEHTLGGQVVWSVSDDQGKMLDQSKEYEGDKVVAAMSAMSQDFSFVRMHIDGEPWQVYRQRVASPHVESTGSNSNLVAHDDEPKYPAVSIAAAVSIAPTSATLRNLAVSLVGLSAGVWLVSLVLSRAMCRGALAPLTKMVAAAREMDASHLVQRLPVANTRDELEALSVAFNSLLDRVQESYERQRRFSGDASHQLRTPLAAIMGQAEVALRRERSTDEYRRVLATIQQTSRQLTRIVESLLFLARADADATWPDRQSVDLAGWLPEHLQNWAESNRFVDIDFCDEAGEPCVAEVHPVLLGELVNILVDNACKYSPPGTPITLRLRRAGSRIYLDVEDLGPGLAEAELARLFTPFFRSPDARRRPVDGVGLGLSIARRLATCFGGELTATSRAGAGCRFTLTLPTAMADAAIHAAAGVA
jgi:two-component system, OmpR family, sensor kinase